MATLHDRMPAILSPEDFDAWLDPKATPEQLKALLRSAPDGTLAMYPVSRAVNSPKNNGPELTERVRDDMPVAPSSKPGAPASPTLFE